MTDDSTTQLIHSTGHTTVNHTNALRRLHQENTTLLGWDCPYDASVFAICSNNTQKDKVFDVLWLVFECSRCGTNASGIETVVG